MKLLADENFPPTLVSYLQKKRHDVKRIQRSLHGVSDLTVKQKAIKEKRIIISFDKDFLKSTTEEQASVMVLDFPKFTPEEIVPYMDKIVVAVNNLKKKKKPFISSYSEDGLEIVQ